MHKTDTSEILWKLLSENLEPDTLAWMQSRLETILSGPSARELFLTYTLLGSKVPARTRSAYPEEKTSELEYLEWHGASPLVIARIYLLNRVLEENEAFFKPKVSQLIQVADKGELESFLRYLSLLPDAGYFRPVAVEALRTNIATVFDAIALDNPYPARYFNEQQWNQMYLKAAFMQRDLSRIPDIEKRANKDLARIISDYAHERWAASRDVDPMFWRPVGTFLEGTLLEDMKKLLESNSSQEQRAAALCCSRSGNREANALMKAYPALAAWAGSDAAGWNNLKE